MDENYGSNCLPLGAEQLRGGYVSNPEVLCMVNSQQGF